MPGGRGYWQRQLTTAASSGFILNAHSQSTVLPGTTVEADGPGSNASRPTWTIHELVDSRTLIVRESQPSLHRPPSLLVSGLLQGRTALSLRWIAFQLEGSESLRATNASSSVTQNMPSHPQDPRSRPSTRSTGKARGFLCQVRRRSVEANLPVYLAEPGGLVAVCHCSSHKPATLRLPAISEVHLLDFDDRVTLFAEKLVNSTIDPPLEFYVHVRPVHPR